MKNVMSLAALLVAVATLAGCCNMCGDKKPKSKKMHHKVDHKKKGHASTKKMSKPVKKHESEFSKIRREADHLMEEL